MTTLFLIVITIGIIIKEELDMRRKRKQNWAASQKRVKRWNENMEKWKELQNKSYKKS